MQSAEEKKEYYNVIIKTCYIANISYLLTHVIYFILFLVTKVYPLVYVNIVSIVLYCLFFIVLKKKKYYIYALLCGNEILIYMTIASVLVGFDSGFHLCIIGLCVVSFFSNYFAKTQNKIRNSIIWCSLSFILVVGTFIYANFNKPIYQIDQWLKITLYSIHIADIFAFITVYLSTFLNYAIKLEARIMHESRTDKLTQIHNRYDLYNYISSLDNKNNYSLSMFDIDDFKYINDEYGHLCGDVILKELASLAKDEFKDDFVSRYGGEEFIIILKMYDDINDSINKLETFRKNIESHEFIFEDNKIHLTLTIGVEQYSDKYSVEEWINQADKKLYYGKRTGKNRTVDTIK